MLKLNLSILEEFFNNILYQTGKLRLFFINSVLLCVFFQHVIILITALIKKIRLINPAVIIHHFFYTFATFI